MDMDNANPAGEPAGQGEAPTPVALAVTDAPVELKVGLVEDERTPEGMVCMGTYRGERLVARCVMRPGGARGVARAPVPAVRDGAGARPR